MNSVGHDLAAFKACADRDGGKDHLEQECLGTHDALFKNALDDVHTAAVIRARTDKQCEQNHHNAADRRAEKFVFKKLFEELCAAVHRPAEQHTGNRTQNGDDEHTPHCGNVKCRDIFDEKMLRGNAHNQRQCIGRRRGHDAREQRRGAEAADADDLYREDTCRHRRAEYRREHAAHTAHGENVAVFLI